jgi:hypothetical protein
MTMSLDRRRANLGVLLLGALWLLSAFDADASAKPPKITTKPLISGSGVVGGTLTADGGLWTGTPPFTLSYQWGRCLVTAPVDDNACDKIIGATSARYVVVEADVGSRLAVRLTVTNAEGADTAFTRTGVIPEAPMSQPPPVPEPQPQPLPEPKPAPEPVRTPSGTFTAAVAFDTSGPATPAPTAAAPKPAPPLAAKPAMITPFPVIRVRGFALVGGVRLSLLSVSRTRRARVTISCSGPGCPMRTLALAASARRARAFERFLPAGTRLAIRVTMPGHIGKYTSFAIGTRRPPTRVDRCLMPGRSRPVRCPSS